MHNCILFAYLQRAKLAHVRQGHTEATHLVRGRVRVIMHRVKVMVRGRRGDPPPALPAAAPTPSPGEGWGWG